MKSMKELIDELKTEMGKGEKADKTLLEEIIESMTSTSARDAAMYDRAKKKAAAIGDRSPEDLDRISAENDDLRLKLEETTRRAEKAEKDKASTEKALTEKLGTKSQAIQRLMRDEALLKELTANGVKTEFLGPVSAYLRDRVQVDEDAMQAFGVGKDKDGKETKKALAEYVKEWAGSDEGKHYVAASASSGAGAGGGGSGGGGGGVDLSKLSPTERLTAARMAGKK